MGKFSSWFYKFEGRQYIPKKEDVEDRGVVELSKRLKKDSYEKTLTNVLEWQDRNIKYWDERAITTMMLMGAVFLSIMIIFYYLNKTNNPILSVIVLFLGVLYLVFGKDGMLNVSFNIIFLFVFLLFYVSLLALLIGKVTLNTDAFLFLIGMSILSGVIISIFLHLVMKYRNIKQNIPTFQLGDTFKISLSVEKILKYRLSICRDYAKLTAALLLNAYPKDEIFFVLIPKHVAVGIKIKQKYYVLDQRLPIRDLDSWLEFWKKRSKKKNLNEKFVKIYIKSGKIQTEITKINHQSESNTNNDINNFIEKLKKKMNLQKSSVKGSIEFDVHLKNFFLLNYGRDIVENSILEFVKNRIEDETVGNIEEISDLIPSQQGDDLIIKIKVKNGNSKNIHK